MGYVLGLRCRECGRRYPKEPLHICDFCFGPLEIEYDYEAISKVLTKDIIATRPPTMWRYKELLPIDGEPDDGLNSGMTPLIKANNLAEKLGVKELYIKDDSVNHPTLSFKDRVVAVAFSKAKEFGFDTVACASTGNLAHAVSAQAAIAKLHSFIFIPADLEVAKIVASLVYRSTVVGVKGNYDQVNRLCSEIAARFAWAFVNINMRPYYAEGSKTYCYEIIEQLNWSAPSHIIVPVAGGSLISKIAKALDEFYRLGFIQKANTKLYAAQAEGCAPVVTAIKKQKDVITPVRPNTICKSLAIGNPADGYYAVKAVYESGGCGEVASDEEIMEGMKLLAETEGIFTETAGGVTVAVSKKLIEQGKIPKDETIVICITGNGLKTPDAIMGQIREKILIEPNMVSFEKALKERRLI